MEQEFNPCALCGTICAHRRTLLSRQVIDTVECPRCGDYYIAAETSMALGQQKPSWLFRLSAWCREQNDLRERAGVPRMPFPTIDGKLEDLAAMLPDRPVSQQIDLLLQLVDARSQSYGQHVEIGEHADQARLWVRNEQDVEFLVEAGTELRYLTGRSGRARENGRPRTFYVRLQPSGCLRLEELRKTARNNRLVFVAMWFDEQMTSARDNGLLVAIREAGFEPVVINLEPSTEHRIDARIIVEIQKCGALVADATGMRPSVMFEAGFAEGLGRPVVWTVRRDWIDQLPFDTRQLPHVVWDAPEDLAQKLRPVLEHRLGRFDPNK